MNDIIELSFEPNNTVHLVRDAEKGSHKLVIIKDAI